MPSKPTSTGRPVGHPPFVPTPEQRHMVKVCRACGMSAIEIGLALKIHKKTVMRYFRQELLEAKPELVARLNAQVVRLAMKGNTDMLKFYLRNHGGEAWQQDNKQRLEHSGPGGEALVPPSLVIGFLQPETTTKTTQGPVIEHEPETSDPGG